VCVRVCACVCVCVRVNGKGMRLGNDQTKVILSLETTNTMVDILKSKRDFTSLFISLSHTHTHTHTLTHTLTHTHTHTHTHIQVSVNSSFSLVSFWCTYSSYHHPPIKFKVIKKAFEILELGNLIKSYFGSPEENIPFVKFHELIGWNYTTIPKGQETNLFYIFLIVKFESINQEKLLVWFRGK